MHIIDNKGLRIEVTDLNAAIRQARRFKGYRHNNNSDRKMDECQSAYWTDIYNKLIQLKQERS